MKRAHLALVLFALLFTAACKKNSEEVNTDKYQLVAESSKATWKGYLRTGYFNEGTIQVESTDIVVSDNIVKSGNFLMPLSSLINTNLPPELQIELIHHLQSPDFFNMLLYPNVSFTFQQVVPYTGNDPNAVEGANFVATGLLSILGKPLPISFPAKIEVKDGQLFIAAKVKVDRTKWGMTYASDPDLSDEEYIMPEMDIKLDLKGIKK